MWCDFVLGCVFLAFASCCYIIIPYDGEETSYRNDYLGYDTMLDEVRRNRIVARLKKKVRWIHENGIHEL